MRFLAFGFIALLTACSQKVRVGGVSDPQSWITPDRSRKLAEEYIVNRGFEGARMVEERGVGHLFHYRFATGKVIIADSVVVDRKDGKITHEHVSH